MADRSCEKTFDDEAIVLGLMYGDEEALGGLLRLYGAKTKRLLKKKLGDVVTDSDIDDALNVAACKAFNCAHKFDDKKGTLDGWFYRIAHNSALDILRKEKRHRHDELKDAHLSEKWQPDCLKEDKKEDPKKRCLCRDLTKAIENLPDLQRKIIMADLACGEEAAALAERFGTSKGSIYVSRTKARRKLREEMITKGHFKEEKGEATNGERI